MCRGRRQRNFFSQRLGQLRPADAHALTRFDLGAQAGNRPVRPVGNRLFKQGRDHAQRGFALHRRRPRRDARLQRIHTAPAKIAAPQPNRVLPHTERFRDPRTAPAGQGKQHRARPVRFPAITRPCESRQGHALFVARHNRRFAAHAPPTRIGASSESQNHRVGQPTGICLATPASVPEADFPRWARRLGGSQTFEQGDADCTAQDFR